LRDRDVWAAMPTDTASASSLLRPCPVESSRTVPRAWRGHRRHQCRRREAEWSTASQGRSHLRSPKRPLRFWPMGVRRWVSVRRGGVLGTPDGTCPSEFRRRWVAPPIRPVCG
jgi:hypothetical protein